jgi:hypothetical protein
VLTAVKFLNYVAAAGSMVVLYVVKLERRRR